MAVIRAVFIVTALLGLILGSIMMGIKAHDLVMEDFTVGILCALLAIYFQREQKS